MILDTETIIGLLALSGAVSVLVEAAKRGWRLLAECYDWSVHKPAEKLLLRLLGVGLGVVGVTSWLGLGPVEVAVGMMAGAASEIVYRWLLSRLPDRLDSLR